MRKLIAGCMLLWAIGSFTSCEPVYYEPTGNPADTTKIPVDTIDIAADSLKIGLIAYYPFTGNANDSSGNNYNGDTINVVSVTDRHDQPNSAYYFTGDNSFIKILDTDKLRLYNTSFTVNYWINAEEYNASHGSALLHKRGAGSNNGWHLSFTGAEAQYTAVGKIGRPSYGVSGGDDPFAVGDKYLQKNIWYMITSTYDLVTQEYKTYINGVLDNVTPGIPSPVSTCSADLYIGRDSIFPEDSTPLYFLKGKMDDIRIYDRIITDTEMQKLFVISN